MLDFIEKAKANIEMKEVTPDLLRAFEASLTDKNYSKRQSFFEKIKEKFDF